MFAFLRRLITGAGRAAATFVKGASDTVYRQDRTVGQPSPVSSATRMQLCQACGEIGPLRPRLPCVFCDDNPAGRDPTLQHPPILCVFWSRQTWWKPWTWGSGTWLPINAGRATHQAHQELQEAQDALRDAHDVWDTARRDYRSHLMRNHAMVSVETQDPH